MRKKLQRILNYWLSYRGAERWSADRGFVPGWVQDPRFDASQVTRWELVRKSRYFEKNNAIFNRLADLFEQFVVGYNGLQIIPASSDDGWNDRATEAWADWQTHCDLISNLPFSHLQRIGARDWFVDGEAWIHLTSEQPDPRKQPEPRIQLIEAHRVGTPADREIDEGKTMNDGVELNPQIGRPIAFWTRKHDDSWQRVPADKMIQLGEASRPGQYRLLPFCYPIINDLIDLDDLQILEMRAAKDAAEKSTIILNESGELDHRQLRSARVTGVSQTTDGTEASTDRMNYYRKMIGGRTLALKKGEDIKQFMSTRPSVATQQYWDYLTSKVCAGVGISKLLVFPWSIQGTVARSDLDIANAFFRSRSAVAAQAFTRVYYFFMEWAIRNDRRLVDPPSDWRQVTVRAPRAVNVDIGRNASAMVAELEAGTTTYEQIYAERGQDWRRQFRQRAREEAYLDQCAAAAGTTPERIKTSLAKLIQASAQMEQAEANSNANGDEGEESKDESELTAEKATT